LFARLLTLRPASAMIRGQSVAFSS
jgi:hypothetical protein